MRPTTAARSPRIDFVVVIVAFLVSRLLAWRAGVRLDVGLLQWAWQILDFDLLRHDLSRSLLYLHAQPPVANLIIGLGLKAEPFPLVLSIGLLAFTLGLSMACALLVTFRRLGVSLLLRTVLVTAYTVSPWSLLYEHFTSYEYIVAACLAGALAFLLGFVNTGRWRPLIGAFVLLALVPLTRSLFHVGWLVGVTVIVVLAVPGRRRRALTVAVPAVLLVVAWYAKNLVLFGTFTASTWLGMNVGFLTTNALPPAPREVLIAKGWLSPFARILPFSPLDVYVPLGAVVPRPLGVPAVDDLQKKNGMPNFNHAAYINIAQRYAKDAAWVIRHRPRIYLSQVATATMIYFLPTADFVIFYAAPNSNLAKIEAYRALFDGIVGGGLFIGSHPMPPMTPWPPRAREALWRAPLLPIGLVLVFVTSVVMIVRRMVDPVTGLALVFACWNVLWVTVIGCLFEFGENNRFRVGIHPSCLTLIGIVLYRVVRPAPRRPSRNAEAALPVVARQAPV